MRVVDVLNQRYGRLLVISQWVDRRRAPCSHVLALCDCGDESRYKLNNLRSGNTTSCGCFHKEIVSTHGMSGTKTHSAWRDLLQRCVNTNSFSYENYGGRGITVCKSWLKFENFYEDMGQSSKGLQIDRIDNNKGYNKENCRWVSCKENLENKRTSKYWFINGVRYDSSSIAANTLQVNPSTINFWCQGKVMEGVFYPPKPGCYSRLKYEEAA